MPDPILETRREPATSTAGTRRAANALRGIGFMVASTLMFCLADTLMKLSAAVLPTTETMFVRSLVAATAACTASVMSGDVSHWRKALVAPMALRASADASASLVFQAALARLPFADFMGINQLQIPSLTAASAIFLGEKVGWHRWSAVAAGLAGGLLIIKPGSTGFDWWALAGVCAVLLATVREMGTRHIPPAVPTSLVLLFSSSAVTLAALAGSAIQPWSAPASRELMMLTGAGFFILAGQYMMVTAIRTAELSVVAPFRYAAMIWALVIGYTVWGHIPDALSLLGFVIIAAAGLYTFHRERMAKARPGVA